MWYTVPETDIVSLSAQGVRREVSIAKSRFQPLDCLRCRGPRANDSESGEDPFGIRLIHNARSRQREGKVKPPDEPSSLSKLVRGLACRRYVSRCTRSTCTCAFRTCKHVCTSATGSREFGKSRVLVWLKDLQLEKANGDIAASGMVENAFDVFSHEYVVQRRASRHPSP